MEAPSLHPLNFFKTLFYGGLLKKLRKKFFNDWEYVKENIDDRTEIHYKEEYVMHYMDHDDYDCPCPTREEFVSKLKKLISDESNLSRERINDGIGDLLLDSKPIQSFLENQIKFLRIILKTQTEFFIQYPFLKKELLNLLNYLQEKLSKYNELPSNPIIFSVDFLKKFYLAFDDYFWFHTEFEIFCNWFRVNPIGKPEYKPDMKTHFCYAIGKIENKIIKEHRPKNINKWIVPTIDGNNYSGLKKRIKENKEIDEKLSLFI